MLNIERTLEYAGQASSVFVKPLTQQSALAALGKKRHSRFALHRLSTTIRLRIKQEMAALAGLHCARVSKVRAAKNDYDRSTD